MQKIENPYYTYLSFCKDCVPCRNKLQLQHSMTASCYPLPGCSVLGNHTSENGNFDNDLIFFIPCSTTRAHRRTQILLKKDGRDQTPNRSSMGICLGAAKKLQNPVLAGVASGAKDCTTKTKERIQKPSNSVSFFASIPCRCFFSFSALCHPLIGTKVTCLSPNINNKVTHTYYPTSQQVQTLKYLAFV